MWTCHRTGRKVQFTGKHRQPRRHFVCRARMIAKYLYANTVFVCWLLPRSFLKRVILIIPTVPTFCTLQCFVSCLLGETGEVDTQLTNQRCSSVLRDCMAFMSAVPRSNGARPVMCDAKHYVREQHCQSPVCPRREAFVFHILATSNRRSGVLKHSWKGDWLFRDIFYFCKEHARTM